MKYLLIPALTLENIKASLEMFGSSMDWRSVPAPRSSVLPSWIETDRLFDELVAPCQ